MLNSVCRPVLMDKMLCLFIHKNCASEFWFNRVRPVSSGRVGFIFQSQRSDPFSAAILRTITKQSLVFYLSHKDPIHYGISQKSTVFLSIATRKFLKQFALDVEHSSANAHFNAKRRFPRSCRLLVITFR